MAANTGSSSSSGVARMDNIMEASAKSGDSGAMKRMALGDPTVLLATTPEGNTCLHIASMHDHWRFCDDVLAINGSLLAACNLDGETPLLTAVREGHASLASFLLRWCRYMELKDAVLKQDKDGCNALHHAIRGRHSMLALELIEAEPNLAKAVNKDNESPMIIAIKRDNINVFNKLVKISGSCNQGTNSHNALHASVTIGNSDTTGGQEMDTRLMKAAVAGDVGTMKDMALSDPAVLLSTTTPEGNTCLHIASMHGHLEFCEDVLAINGSLIAAANVYGETPLLTAVRKGHAYLASYLLGWCRFLRLSEAVLKQDKDGCNVLHHAIHRRHSKLALELIEAEPDLARAINKANESPMFMAIKRDCIQVYEKLLRTNRYSYKGGYGNKALHATVARGNSVGKKMDRRLLEAASCGDYGTMRHMAVRNPALLLGTTPQGNTCLHISFMHGHWEFCKGVLGINGSLTAVNADGETPLVAAVTSGCISLASFFLERYMKDDQDQLRERDAMTLREVLTKQDQNECNILHHAIRSGHMELALKLIALAETAEVAAAPANAGAVNRYGESPMFIAVMKDYEEVFIKLLNIPGSAHAGAGGYNALHAAVRNGNSGIARSIMKARPQLAKEEERRKETPVHLAVTRNQVDVLRVLLELDQSLGYIVCSDDDTPLLNIAARSGHVSAAREILNSCPDTPYGKPNGWTCLHQAVVSGQTDFVNFVLTSPQLRKVVNMRDGNGETALHLSVKKCMPEMLKALLRHQDIDVTVLTDKGIPATWTFHDAINSAKSSQWNEVSMLLLNADPKRKSNIYNLHKEIKDKVTEESRKNVKSLTETYTRNTSIVAILMASITFAAAFTLSGWYRSDAAGSQGLPIMAKKFTFQAFMIADTLAMCFSLSVAFICVIARWEDFEFLLHYRAITKKIMWFAYVATIIAFATGLYTVLAPHLLWLAIVIFCLPVLVPILTMLLGRWPVLMLQFRLGRTFKSDLLDMV